MRLWGRDTGFWSPPAEAILPAIEERIQQFYFLDLQLEKICPRGEGDKIVNISRRECSELLLFPAILRYSGNCVNTFTSSLNAAMRWSTMDGKRLEQKKHSLGDQLIFVEIIQKTSLFLTSFINCLFYSFSSISLEEHWVVPLVQLLHVRSRFAFHIFFKNFHAFLNNIFVLSFFSNQASGLMLLFQCFL